MVGQFQQFLAADAGQAEDFDGGEGPERVVFLVGQVAPPAAGDVFGPDHVPDRLRRDPAAQHAVGARDDRSGFGVPGGLEASRGLDTALVGGVD